MLIRNLGQMRRVPQEPLTWRRSQDKRFTQALEDVIRRVFNAGYNQALEDVMDTVVEEDKVKVFQEDYTHEEIEAFLRGFGEKG